MQDLSQGDIVKLGGYKDLFLVVSKNAYLRVTDMIHVCPVSPRIKEGPLHICINGKQGTKGVVLCEQIRLVDAATRGAQRIDRLSYGDIMEVSDAIQGIFEYD